MTTAFVALGAAVCLGVALLEAWLIVAHFSNPRGAVARAIPGGKDLLRSHIDYLMMAQFLFAFYALFRVTALAPAAWIVAALCFGSFFNPFAFLVRATRPHYLETPPGLFKGLLAVSCTATTIGYAATAWILVRAAFAFAIEGKP